MQTHQTATCVREELAAPGVYGPIALWERTYVFERLDRARLAQALVSICDAIPFLLPAYVCGNGDHQELHLTRLPRMPSKLIPPVSALMEACALLETALKAHGLQPLSIAESQESASERGSMSAIFGLVQGSSDYGSTPAIGVAEALSSIPGAELKPVEIFAFGENRLYREAALRVSAEYKQANVERLIQIARAARQEKFSLQNYGERASYTYVLNEEPRN